MRAGRNGDRRMVRGVNSLGRAEESASVAVGAQQLLDARSQVRVGPARVFKKAFQLIGRLAVQGVEEDRLRVGLEVVHGIVPIVFQKSMPRFWRNPPRIVRDEFELLVVPTQTGIKPGA